MPMSPRKGRGRTKARLNLKIDPQLKDWAKLYAEQRGTDITKLICEYLLALKAHDESQHAEAEQI